MTPAVRRSKWKRMLRWSAVIAGICFLLTLVLCVNIYRRAVSPPHITVAKETTYFTEPLREARTVDYLAALNAKLREGITPENNSTVLIWQATGPGRLGTPKYREEFFKLLGCPPPSEQGDCYVSIEDFARRPENALQRCQWRPNPVTCENFWTCNSPWQPDVLGQPRSSRCWPPG